MRLVEITHNNNFESTQFNTTCVFYLTRKEDRKSERKFPQKVTFEKSHFFVF
jgi:hypothetical protein